ncbi:hypothetical protein LAZ67_7003455 [Cordylochernes scorpioides]|uniref:Transposase n=1 Tax=Cordylochernes scorpioides TaxID=51811 RepID=A0ABY6KNU9_9ARAC|nr:hypothetical protein LAZ67_7003455 [Cordylochernes scorpioides]
MEAPLKDCTTLEQRAVIRFLNAEGIQTSQICQRMKNIYVLEHPAYSPDLAPSDYFLFELLKKEVKGKRFDSDEDVQKVVQDFFHTLPKSAYKEENPRTTLLELEQDTGKIGKIVTEDLNLKKTPAKCIPRFLTNEQNLCRLATCEDMFKMTRTDPEWKDKIITGDETWVYGYDPETKRQSAEWRGQGEPRPKKSRILKSRNKVLLVAFLDNKGIVHHEYLPAGQTVIKEMYLSILRRLREAIRKKKARKMD